MGNNVLETNGVVTASRENGVKTDGWIDDFMESISYPPCIKSVEGEETIDESVSKSPEFAFNGVLFILREPAGTSEGEWKKDIKKNGNWFKDIINGKCAKRYRDRFIEMLRYIGKDTEDLKNVAYANIRCISGGSSASEKYNEIINSEDKTLVNNRVNDIIEALTKKYAPVTHVFMCQDIFDAVFPDCTSTDGGLKYNKGRRRKYKRDEENGINYYGIYHPSFWSAFISDES